MALRPSVLPEMRDIEISQKVLKEVEYAEEAFDRQLLLLKKANGLPDGQREIVIDTDLNNVESALIASVWCGEVSAPAQWVLRQRYLHAGWDEVEFESKPADGWGGPYTRATLIEHKHKSLARSVVSTDANYRT